MKRDYILSHTPVEIGETYEMDEIKSAIDSYVIDAFSDPEGLFGGMSLHGFIDAVTEIEPCEQCLVEWYDECDKERPGNAEQLAIAYQLILAQYVRQCIDMRIEP